jgi:hypothetical protein
METRQKILICSLLSMFVLYTYYSAEALAKTNNLLHILKPYFIHTSSARYPVMQFLYSRVIPAALWLGSLVRVVGSNGPVILGRHDAVGVAQLGVCTSH